jgi:hypothetical protein
VNPSASPTRASAITRRYTTGFNTRDPFAQRLAIFKMSTHVWSTEHRAKRLPQPLAAKTQESYNDE